MNNVAGRNLFDPGRLTLLGTTRSRSGMDLAVAYEMQMAFSWNRGCQELLGPTKVSTCSVSLFHSNPMHWNRKLPTTA
jgi:hypothetical protein